MGREEEREEEEREEGEKRRGKRRRGKRRGKRGRGKRRRGKRRGKRRRGKRGRGKRGNELSNVDKKSVKHVMYIHQNPKGQSSVAMTLGRGPQDFNRISKDKLL